MKPCALGHLLAGFALSSCDGTVIVGSQSTDGSPGVTADSVSAESSNAADVAAADLATTDSGLFPLPWDATFETGDLSEFLSATGGWQYTAGGATLAASKAYAHGGSWGLSTSITTDNDASNHESQAMIGLSITLAQATYGAWY